MFLGHHHHHRSFLPPFSLSFFRSYSPGLLRFWTHGFSSFSEQHWRLGHFYAWKLSLLEYLPEFHSLDLIGRCPVALEAVRNATQTYTVQLRSIKTVRIQCIDQMTY